MTSHFYDVIKITSLKYVIKMTSQKFSIFKPLPYQNPGCAPCHDYYKIQVKRANVSLAC